MQIDLRRAAPAGLTTLCAALGLGLVVALLETVTGADLGMLYTAAVFLAGVIGALVLGHGGGLPRLVAHLLAPWAGGLVGALVLAAVLPVVTGAWGTSPLVWLAALQGGLAVWLVRTVPWRQTVRTPASEWRRITGQAAPPASPTGPAPQGPGGPGSLPVPPSGQPAYGAYAETATTPPPAAPATARPNGSGTTPPAEGPRTAGYLKAVAWGAGAAFVLGALGNVTDLPLGVIGPVVAGAVAAWRVPATPNSGLGRYVGAAALASVVGTLVLVLVPGSSGLVPAAALGAAAGAAVGLARKHSTA